MKSLAELQAIRDRAKMAVNVRENSEAKTRVLVGMATCGIAAGARPVLTTISDEVNKRELHDVLVTQTGCIGICQYEPVVEVYEQGSGRGGSLSYALDPFAVPVEQFVVGFRVAYGSSVRIGEPHGCLSGSIGYVGSYAV